MSNEHGRIIDGKALANGFRQDIADRIKKLETRGRRVSLDAVLAEPESERQRSSAHIYASNQKRMCEELGIEYHLHLLPAGATYEDIAGRLLLLGKDENVTAIMLHLPVPEGIDTYRLQSMIEPSKDVEGVNPANIGNIVYGRSSLVPCTALAVLKMIESTGVEIQGSRTVCIGASDIVGKPVAVLMMQREATVISCNVYTQGIKELARSADILIVAVGKPDLVSADMVKPGAVVVDVGVNRIVDQVSGKRKTVGDVTFDAVREVAGWISPVPGGVGPVTVTMLLRNTVEAAAMHP
ncbi:MAG: bifunctional 5,10-methylenetetrahydrofolate dehydrogenase/5,10-methenyltetrahydrofolate cyclohydrolase [Planctomycetes bacterium]|nr:bifunctional 5,10-methylenetetrahydrofolate dehydrogenase/5,10-methenyltetrahydrofolate cyclohydrolase [Planctomycetota bacterium]